MIFQRLKEACSSNSLSRCASPQLHPPWYCPSDLRRPYKITNAPAEPFKMHFRTRIFILTEIVSSRLKDGQCFCSLG
jgi:hypothetical protein